MIVDLAYSGVGSRETPRAVQHVEADIARRLAARGFILRSGGAKGSDRAFESGAPIGKREIYLPGAAFRRDLRDAIVPDESSELYQRAVEIARSIHPAWKARSMVATWYGIERFGQRAHTRNVFQVLGPDLQSRSKFLVCWAPWDSRSRGDVTGGTRTAVRLARKFEVPVFNLVDGRSAINALAARVLELAA